MMGSIDTPKLTENAMALILCEQLNGIQPRIQILKLKKLDKTVEDDRYRVMISDGDWVYGSCMLASQLSGRVASGEISDFSVVTIKRCMQNAIPNSTKKVVIIVDVDVVMPGPKVGGKIGNPQPITLEVAEQICSQSKSGGANLISTSNGNPLVAKQEAASFVPTARISMNGGTNGEFKPRTNTYGGGAKASADKPFMGESVKRPAYDSDSVRQKQPRILNDGLGASSSTDTKPSTNVYPITSLTPYQNKWTIRARVTNKPPMRTYSNSRGEGKLFSVDLADETGEIRGTAFNKEAERFYDMLIQNGVYYISRGQIKPANRQFCSLNNEYELTFNAETQIQPCYDASNMLLPTATYHFVKLSDLTNHPAGKLVDVIGVVTVQGECQRINSAKLGKELIKRDLSIVDETATSVNVTLWGAEAEKFEGANNPVLLIKAAKISDFGGCTLTTIGSSVIQLNPDIEEAHNLRGWYDERGHMTDTTSLSTSRSAQGAEKMNACELLAVSSAGASQHAMDDKAEYSTVKGTIVNMKKDTCLYKACINPECKKKIIDLNDGRYRCEKCNQEFNSSKWRLMLSLCISDLSDSQWITCFEEQAVAILGETADALGYMRENDMDSYNRVFDECMFKTMVFRLRSKMENFNDETRMRVSAVAVQPVNYGEYMKHIRGAMEKWSLDQY